MTLQKKATLVASATSTLLIFIKLTIGIMSGSVAVLASAIDSVLDLIVSVFNFFAVTKSEQPADKVFNYGRGKIEALAAVIEGTVITMSGVYIFYVAIRKAFGGEETKLLETSIIVMLISLVITIALVLYLNYVAKKTGSMVIKSDALHYKTDIFTNGAILVSLVMIQFTSWQIIDSIIGGLIAIYIISEAYKIIKEGVYVLLDGALEDKQVEHIEHIINSEEGLTSYHFLKTRTSGHNNFVDVHLVFTSDILLLEAHRISDHIEERIALLDPTREWVMNMHLDPYDDSVAEHHH
ncbi:MAG TPA: cation transporter [Campylobacterales bacterium]|nr:cation transporter [Campylobacterales bacterium]